MPKPNKPPIIDKLYTHFLKMNKLDEPQRN